MTTYILFLSISQVFAEGGGTTPTRRVAWLRSLFLSIPVRGCQDPCSIQDINGRCRQNFTCVILKWMNENEKGAENHPEVPFKFPFFWSSNKSVQYPEEKVTRHDQPRIPIIEETTEISESQMNFKNDSVTFLPYV